MIKNLRYVPRPGGGLQLQAQHTPGAPFNMCREDIWLDVPVINETPENTDPTPTKAPTLTHAVLIEAIVIHTETNTPERDLCRRVYEYATGKPFPVK